MTRLFPRPWQGLHPAFEPADPRIYSGPISSSPAIGGLIGGTSFALARLVTSSARAVRLSANITVLTVLALGSLSVVSEARADTSARAFCNGKNIDIPPRRLYDRIGSFDPDDAGLAGGLGGVLLAASLRRPWHVTGWRRWLGAFACGSFTGRFSYLIWYTGGSIKASEELADQEKARKARVQRFAADDVIRGAKSGLEGERSTAKVTSVGPQTEVPRASFVTETMLGKIHPDYHNTTPTVLSEDEGPHVTARQEGDAESRPVPATSYRWTAITSSERIVPELESHVEALRKQRQRHAQEAELLWHWLAEKEGEYYKLCETSVGLDAEQEKERLLLYVRALGVEHTNAWLSASKMDWAIADAQKRIAQHKAQMQKDGQGHPKAWMPRAPSADKVQLPEDALKALRKQQKQMEAYIALMDEGTEESIRQMESGVVDPRTPKMPQDIQDKLFADPNWKDVIRALAAQNKRDLTAEKEAYEAVIRDGENRVKSLRKVSDGG